MTWKRGIAILLASTLCGPVHAAELKVLGSVVVAAILRDGIIPEFERETGYKVVAEFAGNAVVRQRIEHGEAFDLVILGPPSVIDDLAKSGVVAVDARAPFGRASLGMSVRSGVPKPDISSVAGFKATLRDAKSVAMTDPRAGGIPAAYLIKLTAEKLGMGDELQAKLYPVAAGAVGTAVAEGRAEIGIEGISEIISEKGVAFVGPLPDEVQLRADFAAGVAANSKEPDAARQLLRFFSSSQGNEAIKARGMEPK